MKKIYMLAAGLFLAGGVFAQSTTKTITSHFAGALVNPQAPQIGIYTWTGGNGYVSGSNGFGDVSVVQLFDASYGITSEGTIDNVKVMVSKKSLATSNDGYIAVALWENNAGAVGNMIDSVRFNLSAIDTSQTGIQIIMDGAAAVGVYNISANFSTISIPANKSFWAGVILPTNVVDGDTAVVLTTAGTYEFADANTHAGTVESSGNFASYGSNDIKVANAVFPTVTLTTVNVTVDNIQAQTKLYPNPANNVVNISFGSNIIASTNIVSLTGQVVRTNAVNDGEVKFDISNLESGFYLYQALNNEGEVLFTNKFIKK